MPTSSQAIVTIVAVIIVLLFLGILFLVMIIYFNNKKVQMLKEKKLMKEVFEKQLLQSKIEIQEQTFNFVSQEIHDNVGQVLSLAKVQLNIMDQSPGTDKSMLKEAKESISKAMTELRDIARSLSSESAAPFNLLQGITDEVHRINRSGMIRASISATGPDLDVKEQHKLILFRVIQESMQNILKHARASEIRISIDNNKERSNITISDNGVGFDADAELKKDTGLGLKNMISRAALLGARASIQSAPQKGTSVTITIPHV